MKITDTPSPSFAAAPAASRAKTPEAAAKQFEEILVKQFVKTMTDGLFESSLSGEQGPGWVGAYGDMQKDVLAEELSKHLIQSGTIKISDMLMRQWKQSGQLPDAAAAAPPGTAPEATPGDRAPDVDTLMRV